MKALVIEAEHLGRYVQVLPGGRLAQVRQVRLHGVVAAARREVGGVDPDVAQQGVGGVAEHL